MSGFDALQRRAAWFPGTGRGLIAATGEDRARLLHAMCTNHVEQLQPGDGCYAFFLNAQGRILCDATILCREQEFLLDTEPETAAKLFAHLDRYIIADDVMLENRTDGTAQLGIEGPESMDVARALGLPVPAMPGSHVAFGAGLVAWLSLTGQPGVRIFCGPTEFASLTDRLADSGIEMATPSDLRLSRFVHGKPRYGEEILETTLPQETQLSHALHFQKGCYLGQEIVERIRSRGHVNKLLHSLKIEVLVDVPKGTQVHAGEAIAGEMITAVQDPNAGRTHLFAYLRAEHLRPDPRFTILGHEAALQ